MDELSALRRFRADMPESAPDKLRELGAGLIAATTAPGAPGAARTGPAARPIRGRRLVLRTAVAVGLVVAVAVAIAAVGGGTDGAGDRNRAAGDPSRSRTGVAPPAAVVPVSAVDLLDRAAAAVDRDAELTPRQDQFIVYESITMDSAGVYADGKDHLYLYRTRRTLWSSVDGSRDGAVKIQHLEPRAYPGRPLPDFAHRDVGTTEWHPICRTDGQFSYARLSRLPADPEAMLAHLRSGYTPKPGRTVDTVAWTAARDLLRESYLPAAQRVALYRAARLIPGVTLVTDAQDAAGRRGVAAARVDAQTGLREEIIFDARTFRYLGGRRFVVDAEPAGAPNGSLVGSTAELSVELADRAPAVKPSNPKAERCS